jgi:hypothetical protein
MAPAASSVVMKTVMTVQMLGLGNNLVEGLDKLAPEGGLGAERSW